MAQSRYKRKLTAIFSADVVGYSRLMGDDEEFTIQTLNSYRHLMTALIEQYSGSVVDAVGDNILAEFTSAADAVQCAVAVQMKLKKKNINLSDSRKMHFRIGINIGDIVHEKNRIYGDDVNIAARIESLADPGGICISRNIYNHIKKQLDFEYDYMGEHSVKNISDPVRVYKVLMNPKDAGKRIKEVSVPPAKKSQLKKWLLVMASIILILSVVLAGVYWKYIYLPAPADIDPEGKMEFNLPTGPSIAVLPFVNMSKDPEQEYFCDGVTENLISVLAQAPQLLVIARNSTFAYKGKSIDVRQIGQELGAMYVVEGSIQKTDDRFRFVVQLIDTDTGLHIWSEQYDREFQDIFDLQDEITLKILKAVGVKLFAGGELYSGVIEGIADNQSLIILTKLVEYYYNPKSERYAWALKNAKEIITKNPEYPYRYDWLATVYIVGVEIGSCEPIAICLSKAADAIKRSFSINANNWWAHINSGRLFRMRKELDKAILSFKKAIALNPNNADSYFGIGRALNYSDKPDEALEYINKAIHLNPVLPYYYLYNLGYSYSLLDQHEKAIKILKKSLKIQPNIWWVYSTLAVSYSLSGQENNAKTAVRELLNLYPDYSIEFSKKTSPHKNQDKYVNHRLEALRKAGVPEKSK